MTPRFPVVAIVALALATSCAMVRADLDRAERSYEQARYEDAKVWLDDLEDDAPGMDTDNRARYYYLRGMTEYRLDHRQDALHYLALTRELVERDRASIRPEWTQIMTNTLRELTPRGRNWLPPEAGATSGGETPEGEQEAGSTPDAAAPAPAQEG